MMNPLLSSRWVLFAGLVFGLCSGVTGLDAQARVSASSSSSVRVWVEDPCKKGQVHSEVRIQGEYSTAGALTVAAFDEMKLPYKGSVEGVQSIFKTPESIDAIEFESDTVFRIYGWCYEVDGLQPAVMPGEYHLSSGVRELRWFFGYARYRSGAWEGYCETDLLFQTYCESEWAE